MGALSRLFAHRGFHGLPSFHHGQTWLEEWIGIDDIHGGRVRVTPDPPSRWLSIPDNLLDDDIFAAVLHLLRLLNALCRFTTAHDRGLAHGLSGCHAEDNLADTGVGDFGDLSRTVCENADSPEESVGLAEPADTAPGNLLIRWAALDLVDEFVGETVTAEAAQSGNVAARTMSAVNWRMTGLNAYFARAVYISACN